MRILASERAAQGRPLTSEDLRFEPIIVTEEGGVWTFKQGRVEVSAEGTSNRLIRRVKELLQLTPQETPAWDEKWRLAKGRSRDRNYSPKR